MEPPWDSNLPRNQKANRYCSAEGGRGGLSAGVEVGNDGTNSCCVAHSAGRPWSVVETPNPAEEERQVHVGPAPATLEQEGSHQMAPLPFLVLVRQQHAHVVVQTQHCILTSEQRVNICCCIQRCAASVSLSHLEAYWTPAMFNDSRIGVYGSSSYQSGEAGFPIILSSKHLRA